MVVSSRHSAHASKSVTPLLRNDSKLWHTCSLDALDVSQNVGPGQSATATFIVFCCNVPGHARAGAW